MGRQGSDGGSVGRSRDARAGGGNGGPTGPAAGPWGSPGAGLAMAGADCRQQLMGRGFLPGGHTDNHCQPNPGNNWEWGVGWQLQQLVPKAPSSTDRNGKHPWQRGRSSPLPAAAPIRGGTCSCPP